MKGRVKLVLMDQPARSDQRSIRELPAHWDQQEHRDQRAHRDQQVPMDPQERSGLPALQVYSVLPDSHSLPSREPL